MKRAVYILAILLVPTIVLGAVLIISNKPISPGDARPYFLAGNVYYESGDFGLAALNYEKAIGLEPDYEEARANLALTYNRLGAFAEAAALLEELAMAHPDSPSYHYDYAVNVVETMRQDNQGTIDEVEDALAHFRKAEGLSPGYLNSADNIAFLEDLQSQYYAKQ